MSEQTATAATPETTIGRDPKWWTLVAVCLGIFILLLDITIVNVALADIQDDLGASLSDLQWVIDAYALSLAALLLTAGSLADLFGRRLVFVIGAALFMVGSVACGAAQDILFLQLARAFQGIGGAAMFATALALIASAFQGRDRGVAFGAFGATTGVAVAVGPVLGGVLTSGISWRWIFFVNVPICLLAIAIAATRVRESHDPRAGRPDWFGFGTFSLALGGLVYGLIRAGQTAWDDGRVVACLVAAAVLLAVFVVSQLVQDDPMFDLGLLRKPTFTGGLIAAFGVSASVFSLLTYLVIYVQNVLGYSAVGAGVRFLFLSGAAFVAAAIAGRLTEKVPAKWLIAPGFVVLGVGLLLIHGIEVDSSWTHLIPGLIVSGLGVGMINTPLASTAVGVVTCGALGHGLGHQLDVPAGRHRHRHRRARHDFRPPGGRRYSHRPGRHACGRPVRPDRHRGHRRPDRGHHPGRTGRRTRPARRRRHLELRGRAQPHHPDRVYIAFASAALCFVLIRQRDFVQQGHDEPAGP